MPLTNLPLIEKVGQFLDHLTADAVTTQKCKRCGSEMQSVDAIFVLYGGNRRWNVALPFCTKCDEDRVALLATSMTQ